MERAADLLRQQLPADARLIGMYNGIHTVEAAEVLGAVTLAEAVVYKIDTDEQNRVTAVFPMTSQHVSHKVTAKAFVLACTVLEDPAPAAGGRE